MQGRGIRRRTQLMAKETKESAPPLVWRCDRHPKSCTADNPCIECFVEEFKSELRMTSFAQVQVAHTLFCYEKGSLELVPKGQSVLLKVQTRPWDNGDEPPGYREELERVTKARMDQMQSILAQPQNGKITAEDRARFLANAQTPQRVKQEIYYRKLKEEKEREAAAEASKENGKKEEKKGGGA